MRIERIQISAYGMLRDVDITISSPVTLVYGPNEAGKSTLLSFIRAVLFGFAPRASAERYMPYGGGALGGAVTVRDEQGRTIRIERFDAPEGGRGRAPAAGTVKVWFPDGTVGGEEELSVLLKSMTPALFRSLFAFGLTELQELRLLDSREVGAFLYGAGLGASAGSLRLAERKLLQELEALYKPRGRTTLLNKQLLALDEAEQEVRLSAEAAERYSQLLEEIAGLHDESSEKTAKLAELEQAAAWYARCRQVYPHWQRLTKLQTELKRFADTPYMPEEIKSQLQTWQAEAERLAEEQSKMEMLLSGLSESAAAELQEDEVLRDRHELEALCLRRAAYEEDRRLSAALQLEAEQSRQELGYLLQKLGDHWEEQWLDEWESLELVRAQVERFDNEWRLVKQEAAELAAEEKALLREEGRARLESQQTDWDESTSRWREAGLYEDADEPAVRARLNAVLQARQQFYKWKESLSESQMVDQVTVQPLPNDTLAAETGRSRRQSGNWLYKVILTALLVLTVVVPTLLAVYSQMELAIAAFVVLLTSSLFAAFSGKRSRRRSRGRGDNLRSRADRPYAAASSASSDAANMPSPWLAQERQLALRAELAAALHKLTGPVDKGSSAELPLPAEKIGPWLDALEEHLRSLLAFLATSHLSAGRHAAFTVERNRLSERRGKLMEAEAELTDRWSSWLAAKRLPGSLQTGAVLELLPYVEQAQSVLRRLTRQQNRLNELEQAATAFEEEVAARLPLEAGASPLQALTQWEKARDKKLRELEQQKSMASRQAELEQYGAQLEAQQQRLAEHIAKLLEQYGARDEEDFIHLYERQMRRHELESECKQAQLALSLLFAEQEQPELARQCTEMNEEQLDMQLAQVRQAIKACSEQVAACVAKRERKLAELALLEQEAEQADKQQRLEEQRAEVHRLFRKYAVYSLSRTLLERTKRLYEQEKQPAVMRRASRYFQQLTQGSFERLVVPLGEQKVIAVRKDGSMIETAQLSRGTAEQMFICIRLALADEYVVDGIQLPVLMDDAFVNFDDRRLDACLQLMREQPEGAQRLIFTCHEHVAQRFAVHFGAEQVLRMPVRQ